MNRVEATLAYLQQEFEKSPYLAAHSYQKTYRLDHTMRVTNIGKRIAREEGLDEEAMTIACLLHDLSYCQEFGSNEEWLEHGRISAKLAEPFLKTLYLPEETVAEIFKGIAVHMDDPYQIEHESVFVRTIGNADNIDRIGVWRLQESLQQQKFLELPFLEQKKYLAQNIKDYKGLLQLPMATGTAEEMWKDSVEFRIHYYKRLYRQLELSESI